MDMDAVLLFTIDIAADMVPPFQDQALLAGLMHLVGKDTAKEAAADDDVIVHNLVPHFVINGLRESQIRRSQAAGRFVGAVLSLFGPSGADQRKAQDRCQNGQPWRAARLWLP